MSNFKTIFVIVFGAAAIFAILVFSGVITLGSSAASQTVQGTVNVWGTFDTNAMSGFITNFNNSNSKITIIYDQKDPATFDQDLIEAIAAGTPWDANSRTQSPGRPCGQTSTFGRIVSGRNRRVRMPQKAVALLPAAARTSAR